MAESLESYPILAESPMIEETLDSMPKQAKNEQKDETSESGNYLAFFWINNTNQHDKDEESEDWASAQFQQWPDSQNP